MEHRHTGRSLSGFAHRGRQGVDIVRAVWPRLTTESQRIGAIVPCSGSALEQHAVAPRVRQQRELDIFARADHLTADTIEREVAHLEALRRGLSAAQQDSDTSQQFHEGERRNQINVRAAIQAQLDHALIRTSSVFTAASDVLEPLDHAEAVPFAITLRVGLLRLHDIVRSGL